MNDDDLLQRAIGALRDEGDGATPREVAATRARVLETRRAEERRRARVWLVLVPIAAVLLATTALARTSPAVRRLLERASIHLFQAAAPARPPVEARPVMPPTSAVPPALPVSPSPPAVVAAPSDEAVVLPPREAPPVAARGPSPRAAASASSRPVDADDGDARALALFREAHRLHFTEHRYDDAVRAWDAYLAVAPQGALAVEARYDRAVALVRLGRRDEARAALTPFAAGAVEHGYRQAEAGALLDALGAPP